ncbi:xyloglucan galactosyltransferase KATAMARI1 homolog [Brachypodium distachyon]|uniref:Exostosin GT47 domain-containing protein n=1 Tax=Brachypodium distachyon TaxID=15368 RepID=I1I4G2_BRADI|nr:xyloglucan galactosyltransferase KATAMARI1 homolog [Brachypodium distachyon]KQJ96968.1 hypothetical protein BRADI_3g28006v3 [Brachypodium distachyon]|eukprot:XP_003571842.1 xyloglucan galactosyltransferase KATAMARI1 homolog [Brachypodium distachyon]
MKPCSVPTIERYAAGDNGDSKHPNKGDGAGLLIRPSRLFYLTVLSTAFWTLVFYFNSTAQGNVASTVLFKRSAFSLPSSFRFVRDRCAGRYIYMYDLPARFNADLVPAYQKHSPITDMSNDGLGSPITPDQDGAGFLPEKGAYDTDQHVLGMIFHARMKRYECLTHDPAAAAAVFVPFYAGFDASMRLWKTDLPERDALARDLVEWLTRRPEWRAMGGRDHFLVAGRVAWDFLRGKDDNGWGTTFLTFPAIRNTTVLSIEASPWVGHDFGVPYPSHFHPASDADVAAWQGRMRQAGRKWLWAFAGGPRPGSKKTVRAQIIQQCSDSSTCATFASATGHHNSPGRIMALLESARFCLQPCGDSFTRKSTFDAILAGCIPVYFHPLSAYVQYTWHLPRDYRSYSVFIPQADVARRNVSIEDVLRKIPPAQVARMREEVIRLIPRVMYRDPTAKDTSFKDAFDVAVDAVVHRVAKRRRAAAEGREYVDSVDGNDSWKYDLLEDGQNHVGPHEFDPYM